MPLNERILQQLKNNESILTNLDLSVNQIGATSGAQARNLVSQASSSSSSSGYQGNLVSGGSSFFQPNSSSSSSSGYQGNLAFERPLPARAAMKR